MINEQEIAKRRTYWACHRGMLEVECIILPFFDQKWGALSATEQGQFERLLDNPDPDLYNWLMGYEEADDRELANLVEKIRVYKQSGH